MKDAGDLGPTRSIRRRHFEHVVRLIRIKRTVFAAEYRMVVHEYRCTPFDEIDQVEVAAEIGVRGEPLVVPPQDQRIGAQMKLLARQQLGRARRWNRGLGPRRPPHSQHEARGQGRAPAQRSRSVLHSVSFSSSSAILASSCATRFFIAGS